MAFSTKFNAGIGLLPVGLSLLLTNWSEPLETAFVAIGLTVAVAGASLIISFLSKYDGISADKRVVNTSWLAVASFLFAMVIVLIAPNTVPPRDALPEVVGAYRGTEDKRRHREVIIESEGIRKSYALFSTFFDELYSVDIGTTVTVRLHKEVVADLAANGRSVIAYDDYVKEYKNTRPMLAMFGVALAAYIYYSKRRATQPSGTTGDSISGRSTQ